MEEDNTQSDTQPQVPEKDEPREVWPRLSEESRAEVFASLPRHEAEELFLDLGSADQCELFLSIPPKGRRSWIRVLPPDDAADLIQELPEEEKREALQLLDYRTRIEVNALMAYAEDEAGGLMNSRFARIRGEMTVDEAIRYLRVQTRTQVETVYYAYVLDSLQVLKGVVTLRQLFAAPPETKIYEIMKSDLVTVPENMDQEEVARIFMQKGLMAIPVVDGGGRMKGIVTVDDIVDALKEEATEDIQKIGGAEALEGPYLHTSLTDLIKKRFGWLLVLFIGQMLTASAMSYFEQDIEKAVVLALFIPLVISSGGNSGSQASTLIIRSLALGEVEISDWWRVLRRELISGLILGAMLGVAGVARIVFWPASRETYGEHFVLIGLTVGISLLGIVLWGCVTGSMLPFVLRKFKLDPATASAPFVATLVDVTGLVIYFTLASIILGGTLL